MAFQVRRRLGLQEYVRVLVRVPINFKPHEGAWLGGAAVQLARFEGCHEGARLEGGSSVLTGGLLGGRTTVERELGGSESESLEPVVVVSVSVSVAVSIPVVVSVGAPG